MEFKTKYSDREKIFSEPGSQLAPVYSLCNTDNGSIELEITGETNIYDAIQSHAESVDIKTIMLRYENGEDTLNKRQGQYIDITDLPTNFTDVMKTVITAENQFNNLPLEIRKEYNFSAAEYISDIGSDRWNKLFTVTQTETQTEVKTDEQE